MSQEWCTIESDPGVFTELIESFGVKGVQVEELYDLSQVYDLRPVYGMIFLFKWRREGAPNTSAMEVDDVPGLFFARQVIQNACATQAIISVLLNSPSIELGEELSNFKSFTVDLPPDMRGLSLASAETIRAAHNSFGRPEAFELPDVKPDEKEEDDAFHFVSFIPFNGNLYELDGLKPAPVCHGPCTDDDWLEKAVPVIQERIQSHSHEEIRFNLMAVIANRQEQCGKRLTEMEARRQEAVARLNGTGRTANRISHDLPHGKDELAVAVSAMDAEIEQLKDTIVEEKRKFERWHNENMRRKHNYIPFVFNLLRQLADKDLLTGLVDRARAQRDERRAAAAAAALAAASSSASQPPKQ
ncbi:Ubiquitin carboxyl-terminal hydrolase [Plasmodiophora brassicae]